MKLRKFLKEFVIFIVIFAAATAWSTAADLFIGVHDRSLLFGWPLAATALYGAWLFWGRKSK